MMPAANRGRLPFDASAFRIIPEIDKNPRIIAFAETLLGKILLIAGFAILLIVATHPLHNLDYFLSRPRRIISPLFLGLMAGIVLCTFLPSRRPLALCLSVIIVFFISPLLTHMNLLKLVIARQGLDEYKNYFFALRFPIFILVFFLMAAFSWGKTHCKNAIWFRRPVLFLLIVYFSLILFAASHVLHGAPQVLLWIFISVFGPYFWFFAYAQMNAGEENKPSLLLRLGLFYPFWNLAAQSIVPYNGNINQLKQVNADTARDFSITQLKGIKLLLWCIILQLISHFVVHAIRKYFHVPMFKVALAAQIDGTPYPPYFCWASLFYHFCISLLYHAIVFGIVIATARMAGFRLLRNTYKPLSANSIAEFWRRVSFYFYQIMMTFFFYPTFFSCFTKYKRLRLFFATFMAACVGNILFHFMGNSQSIAALGLINALVRFQNYVVYAFVLAVGIGISQLVSSSPNVRNMGVLAITAVRLRIYIFFCMLSVFDDQQSKYALLPRFKFILHLFGL